MNACLCLVQSSGSTCKWKYMVFSETGRLVIQGVLDICSVTDVLWSFPKVPCITFALHNPCFQHKNFQKINMLSFWSLDCSDLDSYSAFGVLTLCFSSTPLTLISLSHNPHFFCFLDCHFYMSVMTAEVLITTTIKQTHKQKPYRPRQKSQ